MKQLHFLDTLKPMFWKELDNTQKKIVLWYHMFLKEKSGGEIKGQTEAVGNKHKD